MSAQKPTPSLKPPSKPRGAKFRIGTLGPVADLERHLPSEWWRELFDSVYLQTDGDVVENDNNTVREIDFLIQATGITPQDRILDLCCGQGRHVLELARRGYTNVAGIDRSRYLVRLARRRAAKLGFPVSFHDGDARKFAVRESATDCVIMMGNSFGYFDTEQDDLRVLERVKRALRSGGTFALDITDGDWMRDHFEKRSWEWIDEQHFVCRERSLASDGDRLVSREVVVHSERGVIADQFYAERLYSRARIVDHLERLAFRNVRVHASPTADSDRNQDLGMMANRLFVTSDAPRREMVVRGRKAPVKVTVVMGDPRLPDALKRDGQFNPEDIATVARLKDALAELPAFSFSYLDNHATLEKDLNANPPDFVFNLCDEGFNNDAFQELHVPAFLDVAGIPYTGAGPACLGACYDKALVRAVAMALDIPVPLETFVSPDDQSATIPSTFPALLKPNFGDSSLGITQAAVVWNSQQLVTALNDIRDLTQGRPVLVQEFLTGSEFSVTLIGNPGGEMRALPILEVDYSRLDPQLPRILGYESKWLPDSPYWSQIGYRECELDQAVQRTLINNATNLFGRLRCCDYARFDYRTDAQGTIKLLEVNPNPGWCWDGKMNFMAGFAGMRYPDLLRIILEAAAARIAVGAKEATGAQVAANGTNGGSADIVEIAARATAAAE